MRKFEDTHYPSPINSRPYDQGVLTMVSLIKGGYHNVLVVFGGVI